MTGFEKGEGVEGFSGPDLGLGSAQRQGLGFRITVELRPSPSPGDNGLGLLD